MASVFTPLNGKLTIKAVSARDLHVVQSLGVQDPYCRFRFGKFKKASKVDKNGGKFPTWNQEFSFELKEEENMMLEITVMNKNNLAMDDIIGTLEVHADLLMDKHQFVNKILRSDPHLCPSQQQSSGSSSTAALAIGTKQARFIWTPNSKAMVAFHRSQGSICVEVLPLLEIKVQGLSLKIPKDQNLSEYFGFDPLKHHISGKVLDLHYRFGGEAKSVQIAENLFANPNYGVVILSQKRDADVVIKLEDYAARQEEVKEAARKDAEARHEREQSRLEKERVAAEKRAKEEAEMRQKFKAERDEAMAKTKALRRMIANQLKGLRSIAPPPHPIAFWDFSKGVQDQVGGMHLKLKNGCSVQGGALVLDGKKTYAESLPFTTAVLTKTIMIWCQVGNIKQRGGGLFCVQADGNGCYDGIVYGEHSPETWGIGSEFNKRSSHIKGLKEQDSKNTIHLAVSYEADGTITIYRNGERYGNRIRKSTNPLPVLSKKGVVLFGLRPHCVDTSLIGLSLLPLFLDAIFCCVSELWLNRVTHSPAKIKSGKTKNFAEGALGLFGSRKKTNPKDDIQPRLFAGKIMKACVYDRALADQEIVDAMLGTSEYDRTFNDILKLVNPEGESS
eukprot:jgi/Bigna1/69089/fgenesh1_pg.8_\